MHASSMHIVGKRNSNHLVELVERNTPASEMCEPSKSQTHPGEGEHAVMTMCVYTHMTHTYTHTP